MEKKILTLDIETTGLPPKKSKYDVDFELFPNIVSIAWKINEDPAKEYILNQEGKEIPEESIEIHKITNEIAKKSPYKFKEICEKLLKEGLNSTIVVGHGIYFDTSIIKANTLKIENNKMYDDFTELLHKDKRIDTMMKCIKFCGKWPKLSELYFKLFNENFNAHNAKDDVEATYKCYKELLKIGIIQ